MRRWPQLKESGESDLCMFQSYSLLFNSKVHLCVAVLLLSQIMILNCVVDQHISPTIQ